MTWIGHLLRRVLHDDRRPLLTFPPTIAPPRALGETPHAVPLRFQVKFYKGSYRARQEAANHDGAIVFVAHHLNASTSHEADYAMAIVATNASPRSIQLADVYTDEIRNLFGVPEWDDDCGDEVDGVHIGGFARAGNSQIVHTTMPAFLPEPLFCSNAEHAAILRSEAGREALAEALAETICAAFPAGGLVAFSVGHKYKPKPHHLDRGAPLVTLPGEELLMEADVVEDILRRSQVILEAV